MNLEGLKEQISNLTLYDVKAAVRKAQNVVMNYTEMEAKVREATNNEPWGASSTLMQEIANGTYNYQLLSEIMPMIYKRFTDKSAEEWRQIYKALQLLEFLVKNGSEQVVDDARSHISTVKMLRQFHYIDVNGKDQGLNVRNRAKELGELLSDVDRIRAERKKARTAKTKYNGVEGGISSSGYGGFSGGSSSARKYGGFGSDSLEYGGYSGGVYGDGGGFGGTSSSRGYNDDSNGGFRSGNGSQKFDEYDEYDEVDAPASNHTSAAKVSTNNQVKRSQPATPKTTEPPPKSEPVKDLLSLDDDLPGSSSSAPKPASGNILGNFGDNKSSANNDDDEFDEFQSAGHPSTNPTSKISRILPLALPTNNSLNTAKPFIAQPSSATAFAAPQPRSAGQAANLSELATITTPNLQKGPYSPPPLSYVGSSLAPQGNPGYQALKPSVHSSVSTHNTSNSSGGFSAAPSSSSSGKAATAKQDAFGSIWTAASSGLRKTSSTTPPVNSVPMAAMAKEKASAGIWGSPKPTTPTSSGFGSPGTGQSNNSKGTHGLEDLLG